MATVFWKVAHHTGRFSQLAHPGGLTTARKARSSALSDCSRSSGLTSAPAKPNARRSRRARRLFARGSHKWRGTSEIRGRVKQRTKVAHSVGTCAPPHNLPSTTNHQQRSVFKTVGLSSIFKVGREPDPRDRTPLCVPRTKLALRTARPVRRRPDRTPRPVSWHWWP